MADPLLTKVADVLEKVADFIDAAESEKIAAVTAARDTAVKTLTERYTELTGEDLPHDVAEKLASSDESVLATVQKLMEKSAGTGVESMGRSSEQPDDLPMPKTKQEKKEAAWNRFGSFINS